MNKNSIIAIAALVVVVGAVLIFSGKGGVTSDNGQPAGLKTENGKSTDSIENVCAYFPKELIETAIGKPVLKVEGPSFTGTMNCLYYTIYADDYDYSPYTGKSPGGAPVVVTYSTDMAELEADRASNEKTGSKYEKDASIAMDNYVVRDFGGTIWQVILILEPGKYVRMHFVHSAVTGPELLKIAIKFAERIQGN